MGISNKEGYYSNPQKIETLGLKLQAVIDSMKKIYEVLESKGDPAQYFIKTYVHTNQGVLDEILAGGFEDNEWLEQWAVAYASKCVIAYESYIAGTEMVLPWEVAFKACKDHPDMDPVQHLVILLNAHLNHDLALGLLEVTKDEDFLTPESLDRMTRDHAHVNKILLKLVASEHKDLLEHTDHVSFLERIQAPLEEMATKHWVKEARLKTWVNAKKLGESRRDTDSAEFENQKKQLREVVAARVSKLVKAKNVALSLAIDGFGVVIK